MNVNFTLKSLGSQLLAPSRLCLVGAISIAPLSTSAFANNGASESEAAAAIVAAQDTAEVPVVESEFRQALTGGKWWLKLRYRFENVDQDGFDDQAHASTLRTVFGYETAEYKNFRGLLEFEDVTVLGDDDAYNSTINGATTRPVVADPKGTEVNRVFAGYTGITNTDVRLGRDRIKLDNDRFIGNVGWRQNEQTFDAASAKYANDSGMGFFYAYVSNVNRIFGKQSPMGSAAMNSHLINASYNFDNLGKVSVYGYLLDYDYAPTSSTNTFGARFAGKNKHDSWGLVYEAEYANQGDTGDNTTDVDADYMHGSFGVDFSGFLIQAGYEVLGGSGTPGDSFQTPLATLHKFNGWADKFLSTPANGLKDSYVKLGWTYGKGNLALVLHNFEPDTDTALVTEYGSEIDAVWGHKVNADLSVGIKYADYSADDAAIGAQAADTTKGWLWAAYSF